MSSTFSTLVVVLPLYLLLCSPENCHSSGGTSSSSSNRSIQLHIKKVSLVFFNIEVPFEFAKHTIAVLEDNEESRRVLLDFVPADRSLSMSGAVTAAMLLVNQRQKGKIRRVNMHTQTTDSTQVPELDTLVDDIVASWDSDINVYSHNCQDFTDHVQTKLENHERLKSKGTNTYSADLRMQTELSRSQQLQQQGYQNNVGDEDKDEDDDKEEHSIWSAQTQQDINKKREKFSYLYDTVISLVFIKVALDLVNGAI